MRTRFLILFVVLALSVEPAISKPMLTETEKATLSNFFGKGGETFIAGTVAESHCVQLSKSFQPPSGVTINNTFTQYFPEGSSASIEYLTKSYPN